MNIVTAISFSLLFVIAHTPDLPTGQNITKRWVSEPLREGWIEVAKFDTGNKHLQARWTNNAQIT